jgi:Tol biopolymer transport system component
MGIIRPSIRSRSLRAAVTALSIIAAGCAGPAPTSTAIPAERTAAASSESPSALATQAPPIVASSPTQSIDPASLSGTIAFSAGSWPDVDIYIVSADGSGLRQVTDDPAKDFDPSLSPDATQVAYRHQTDDDRTSEIFVAEVGGSDPLNVSKADGLADWGPTWSPDGKRIAWNSHAVEGGVGFDLSLIEPDGSNREVVQPGVFVEYPAWSPDGTSIVFMSQEPGASGDDPDYNIYTMAIDGSNVTRLTTHPGNDGWPSWSPDGSTIAFSSTRDDCRTTSAEGCLSTGDIGPYHTLWLMDADGSNQRRVTTDQVQFPDWSPDGRYIVYEGRTGLNVITPDGSAAGRIPLDVADPLFPDWVAATPIAARQTSRSTGS